jgi:hypothetical protein
VSAVAFETPELYRRFKSLAVATSAALILGERVEELRRLPTSCIATLPAHRARSPRHASGSSCTAPSDGEVSDAQLDAVRNSHRSLRREVWTTQPCEYVPCCAGTHHHR